MIVDTSVLVAIIFSEPDRERLVSVIAHASEPKISAASYAEAGIVIDARRNPVLMRALDDIIIELGCEIIPVTHQQAVVARQAYRDFGKGSGHPAQLNFGDCFTYAAAHETREPLLFIGNDFNHTDLQLVDDIQAR